MTGSDGPATGGWAGGVAGGRGGRSGDAGGGALGGSGDVEPVAGGTFPKSAPGESVAGAISTTIRGIAAGAGIAEADIVAMFAAAHSWADKLAATFYRAR